MRTLFLDVDKWDICLTPDGRIQVARGAYGVAQNVANACRLFTNDAYYDSKRGVPHFESTFSVNPNPAVIRDKLRRAALSVEGVASVDFVDMEIKDRVLGGEIRITLVTGETATVTI